MSRSLWFWLVAALLAPASARADDASGVEFFEKKIRPILAENCFPCHSAGAAKLKAGLRLDSRAAMLKGGDSGPAIVSGKPGESRLVRAIGYDDVELRMPPKGKLPAATIAELTEWITRGAPWPEEAANRPVASAFDLAKRKAAHWAWQPIRRVSPPGVRDAAWPNATVDRFILANLESSGLKPAPPADSHDVLRRVYFDLIGLPPPADVARAFAADHSLAAYERIVDGLLASPHFGERWARHWLDLVRYAETRGNEFDYHNPNAWQYRDYVIRALNADVPYNRFVTEHLAGDLLAEPRRHPTAGFNESILATGCWFFGDQVHSPVDLKRDEADHLDAMIDVFSKTFLGLTVSCARCHDHKFDAISTKDYHALFGVFASSGYRQVRFETDVRERDVAAKLGQLQETFEPKLRTEIVAKLSDVLKQNTKPVQIQNVPMPERARVVHAFANPGPSGWLPDGAAFGRRPRDSGDFLLRDEKIRVNVLSAAVVEPALFVVKSEGQNDSGDLGKVWRTGRTISTPETLLTSGRLFVFMRGKGLIYSAVQGHRMIEGPLHRDLVKVVDAGAEFRWIALDLRRYAGHRVHFEFTATNADFAVSAAIESDEAPREPHLESVEVDGIRQAIDRFDVGLFDFRSAAVVDALLQREPPADGPAVREFLAKRKAILAGLPQSSHVAPAMFDGNGFDERVFIRGNPHNPGERVSRRFLEALSGTALPGPGSGRLELARQVTDPAMNPLIGRVFVNRVCHHLFGRGIIASVDNFGVLGETPSHPEMLDWLADDFVRNGWSIKRLIRSLVLSSTYRMASAGETSADAADPQNKLWHRANIRRLDGESIRDAMLAVSGSLDATLFGSPVPIHLTPFMEGRGRPARSGPLDGGGRRSIYLEVRRNFLNPFLTTFDQPGPGNTVGRRSISNVPAQALALLNDPFVHEQAERWSRRETSGTTNERIEHMYWSAFARAPTAAEKDACQAYVENHEWADLAHALWNVKDFIYIR